MASPVRSSCARCARPHWWVVAFAGLLLASLLPLPGVAAIAGAETPTQVVEETAGDGIYIAPSRRSEFDETMFVDTIEDARAAGIIMIVVVPFEAQPSTTAFALRSRQAAEVDVAIVFGPDDVFAADVSEDYENDAIRALNTAREEVTPTAQVETFFVDLTTEPERERSEFINTVVRWVMILALFFLAAAILEQLIRQAKKARRRAQLHRSQSSS